MAGPRLKDGRLGAAKEKEGRGAVASTMAPGRSPAGAAQKRRREQLAKCPAGRTNPALVLHSHLPWVTGLKGVARGEKYHTHTRTHHSSTGTYAPK